MSNQATALWSGTITAGAVNVPVRLYSAMAGRSGESVPLATLHKTCKAPVNQVKRCSSCGDDMRGPMDVVSGYEYAKGRYVLVKKDELPRPEHDEKGVVEIEDFVPARDVDVWLFDRHYWLAPDGHVKAYALLHRALLQKGVAAIVRIVLRTKSSLAIVYPRGGYLMLTTLYYASEVRSTEHLAPGADGVAVRELDFEIMLSCIDAQTNPYRHERYTDKHGDALRTMLADRVEAELLKNPDGEPTQPHRVRSKVV